MTFLVTANFAMKTAVVLSAGDTYDYIHTTETEILRCEIQRNNQRCHLARRQFQRSKIMSDHLCKQAALELCYEIEKLPASELQTRISIMASDLYKTLPTETELKAAEQRLAAVEALPRTDNGLLDVNAICDQRDTAVKRSQLLVLSQDSARQAFDDIVEDCILLAPHMPHALLGALAGIKAVAENQRTAIDNDKAAPAAKEKP